MLDSNKLAQATSDNAPICIRNSHAAAHCTYVLQFMIRSLFHSLFLAGTLLPASGLAGQPDLSKAQALSQSRDFVARLSASKRNSKRPVVGVLNHWELRINTYSDDHEQQLEPSTLYPLYYDCCRTMERLYKGKPRTFLAKDQMGYPSQITIVNFEDVDLGESHLVVGLWEGNDSTGFFFLHLPGSYDLKGGWKQRESWSLEGIFSGAKKPADKGASQPAPLLESKSLDNRKAQPEPEGRTSR